MAVRHHVLAAVAVVVLSPCMALAETASPAAQRDVRRAYDTAKQCFVANGFFRNEFKRSGDKANAQLFDSRAKEAFELSYFYGNMLRLSRDQVTRDLSAATEIELPKLMQSSAYLTTVATRCKQSGLM